MINQKNYKLLLLTTFSCIITTTLFQNCTPAKIEQIADQSMNLSEGISYAPKSVSGAQVITNGNVVLKEYRHKSSNRFFYTSRTQDQSSLDTTYAGLFEVTGNTITLKAAADAGLSPVYRLANKGGFHLYTAEVNERTSYLTNTKYQDEGIEGYAIKINSNATCPTTPVVTYPVYRLSHNGAYKYRLATEAALKSQLLTQGYSDEGVLFCATAVSSTPPVLGGTLACDLNGAAVAHGASVSAYQSPSDATCQPLIRTCSNGVLSGSDAFHFSSCTISASGGACVKPPRFTNPSVDPCEDFGPFPPDLQLYCDCKNPTIKPPVSVGTASCNINGSTVAHGASVIAYQYATGTTCQSEQRTCTNGVPSGSFSFSSCTISAFNPPPPPNPTACASPRQADQTINYSDSYVALNNIEMGGQGAVFILAIKVAANDSSAGKTTLPVWAATNSPVSGTGARIVAVSLCPNDFNPATALVVSAPTVDFTINFTTESSRTGTGAVLLQPGRTYYVNVRNESCRAGQICSIDGQYRNWNR